MLSPNELSRIVEEAEGAMREGVRAALATVVFVSGSAYRRPGARMLIREDGRIVGGVSGGCLEADVVRRARSAMVNGEVQVATYDSTELEDGGFGTGLGCRGVVEILIEPVSLERTGFHLACLRRVNDARSPSVLAIRFRGPEEGLGAIALFGMDGPAPNVAAESIQRAFAQRRWRCTQELLLDYLPPVQRLLLVGGGPDSEPLVNCARSLGYRVMVVDERPGYLSRRRFPPDTQVSTTAVEDLPETAVDAHTSVVIATHNLSYDERALRKLLPSAVSYVGVLGPRQRTARMLEQLRSGEGRGGAMGRASLRRRAWTSAPTRRSRSRCPSSRRSRRSWPGARERH